MASPAPIHQAVLSQEILQWLQPQAGQTLVDGTLGAGGHTRLLAPRLEPGGTVIAFDLDPAARAAAERTLAGLCVKLVAASYHELPEVLAQLEIKAVAGILLDLGLSSDQLADQTRGFSFDSPGPLDLRFDPTAGQPTWQWLETLEANELADLIFRYGEERFSRRIARAVVEQRGTQPIRTARQLAELVRRCVPRGGDAGRIDPATRTFQALRIAVNDELGALAKTLERAAAYLTIGGRMAVISFHSLEDRLVKQAFRDDPRFEVLTKKPIRPSETEMAANPRARSAKLRVARRVA